ncbi:uncharacterized protein LOC131208755 [Anopheles bellator]|uniref:uncharacterized protein LOC131208755 n=1 Tax=Anopheles bellator TaxID=139047 RepID=UPI00264A0706|nr:uncharacterized protein LOC131208755 [Anopheles bellator]
MSSKGGAQLCIEGFPFTRHMIYEETVYWRCIQFRALRCPARHRQRRTTGLIEIVHSEHNHPPIQNRRKRGSLKQIIQQRLKKQPKPLPN